MAGLTATIGRHPDRAGVWCVLVPCDFCGSRAPDAQWIQNCGVCRGTGLRILSTHATRDGAAVSANQINRAERAVCPDCGNPHSGSSMQQPGGYSGCPTCGFCS